MDRTKTTFIVLVMLVSLLSSQVQAFVTWTNSSGSAATFNWSGGGSDNGLFGDPTVIGDTFVFFPQNFRVESEDGVSDQLGDRLQVDLLAHQNKMITGIRITEYGDYGIVGSGQVQVSGTLFMTNLLAVDPITFLPIVVSDNLVSNPVSPILSGSGSWTASAEISGLDWTKVRFVMNNNLMAITDGSSTSFIEKKITGAAVVVTFIPEPATLGILGLGALALLRRRK